MKENKVQATKIIITLVCIVAIVASVIAIIFSAEVLGNKNIKTTYAKIGSTEQKMFEALNTYLNDNELMLDKPVAFVKNNGLFRGRAYVFNVALTENRIGINNGGTYGTEILLPDEYDMPTMYRCCTFAPNFGSLLFPTDYKTQELFGKEVYVISFNNKTLEDGTFVTLLDKMFGK